MMPRQKLPYRIAHRSAGLGSRGRQRFIGIAEYAGALVCREAKALAPSAWLWAFPGSARAAWISGGAGHGHPGRGCPFVRLKNGWIVQRLAPDCTRIELATVPRDKDKTKLLEAMGWETANVHLGSKPQPPS